MSTDEAPAPSEPATILPSEAFELERFAWAGPDRLELAGTFAGLGDAPADAPVLIIHGADRVHRLPAVPEGSDGRPQDGQPWQAAFAWQEPPEPFESAELELGEIVIALPRPGAKRTRFRPSRLPVRRPAPPDGALQIGLQAELLSAREQIRELRIEAERSAEERERAQQALSAERERRAGDAERFRAGLAQVRASAEEALAGTAAATAGLTAERDALRERVEELEAHAGDHAAQLAALDGAREAAGAAGAEAERLVTRLQALRSALGGSG
jgi:hypothetical protein